MDLSQPTFASIFRKFRLQSDLIRLRDFGDALSEEGITLEDSSFSHWQRGSRVPKDRNTMLFILNVFIKRNGISSVKEANEFLEAANFGNLSLKEAVSLFPNEGGLHNSKYIHPKEIEEVMTLGKYYLVFLQQTGKGNPKFFSDIDIEIENIISVINRAIELKLFKLVIDLWTHLTTYLWRTGRWDLLEDTSIKVTDISKHLHNNNLCTLALNTLARIAYWQGKIDKAQYFNGQSLSMHEDTDYSRSKAMAMLLKARIMSRNNHNELALKEIDSVIRASSETDDKIVNAKAIIYKADLKLKTKLVDEALALYCATPQNSIGWENQARLLQMKGIINLNRGQRHLAKKQLAISLAIREKARSQVGIAFAKFYLAIIDQDERLRKESKRLFDTMKVDISPIIIS